MRFTHQDSLVYESRSARLWRTVKRHAAFVGPGLVCSVAYIDPGNWSTDLAAGSQFGYAHLFVVLVAGLFAMLCQTLACRIGCVSGLDLATHLRLSFHDRPRHTMWWRWGLLYPLYVICELGIIATDLAELLGSAIAINLVVPAIPLWAAVLLTSLDVFLILLLFNQYPNKMVSTSMRLFEAFIGLLVIIVLGAFVALLVRVSPRWDYVFRGYVPSSGLIRAGGIYVAVGIIGATVMPHSILLGSKMATMKRLAPREYDEGEDFELEERQNRGPALHLPHPVRLGSFSLSDRRPLPPLRRPSDAITEIVSPDAEGDDSESKGDDSESKGEPDEKSAAQQPEKMDEPPSLACIRAHLTHSIFDICGSLMGFAVVINSAILIVGAAVFYYGDGRTGTSDGVSDLFDAFELVKQYVGPPFAYLFAVGLFASGQAASLTVTLTGQIISEGFIRWRTKPWKRRIVTRLIGIVPSLAVAISVGREGIDNLLVGSQVALSWVLPFVVLPLIVYSASQDIMSVPVETGAEDKRVTRSTPAAAENDKPIFFWRGRTLRETMHKANPFRRRGSRPGTVSFASSVPVIWLGMLVWVIILIANVVAMYELGASPV